MTSITAQKRDGTKAGDLRTHGQIPGVVYGPDREAVAISVDALVFNKLYNEAGESTLVDFTIEGEKEPVKVLIQDVQFDPVKGNPIHVDFRQIQMGVEMSATTELVFVGEAPAVKALGGTLNTAKDTLDIKCLPKDLVSEVEVDISTLATFDDAIHVKDLKLPAGVTADEDGDRLVAKVVAPLTEEQFKAMEEENSAGVDKVEVEEKGKKEEEASAEGGEKKAE